MLHKRFCVGWVSTFTCTLGLFKHGKKTSKRIAIVFFRWIQCHYYDFCRIRHCADQSDVNTHTLSIVGCCDLDSPLPLKYINCCRRVGPRWLFIGINDPFKVTQVNVLGRLRYTFLVQKGDIEYCTFVFKL